MNYLNVNWLAILLAAIASMALGFVWYMALSRPWLKAIGKQAQDLDTRDPSPFAWAIGAQLVSAYVLALVMPRLMGGHGIANGLSTGLLMWLGFTITAMVLNHRYQGAPWALTLIDGGYLLGVLLLQGLVIGIFG